MRQVLLAHPKPTVIINRHRCILVSASEPNSDGIAECTVYNTFTNRYDKVQLEVTW